MKIYKKAMIKELIVQLIISFKTFRRHRFWEKQAQIMLNESQPQADVLPKLPSAKYIILIPHSDDEWIGNSTLISNKEYNVVLCNLNMSGDDDINNHAKRRKEMEQLANLYNRKFITINKNKSCALSKIIEIEKPDYITVPSVYDWHSEHFEVMDILNAVDRDIMSDISVVMYQVTVAMPTQLVTHINKLDLDHWRKKWRIFKSIYKTQKGFPWYRLSRIELINGRQRQMFACEVFSLNTFESWKQLYVKHQPNKTMKTKIKENLNSIILSITISNNLYEHNSNK